MSVPARLSRTLHQRLGDEADEDLVNWMVQVDSNRSEIRDVMDVYTARMDARFEAFTAQMDARFAAAESKADRRHVELLKWSFLFWCGAVLSIAALARVLR